MLYNPGDCRAGLTPACCWWRLRVANGVGAGCGSPSSPNSLSRFHSLPAQAGTGLGRREPHRSGKFNSEPFAKRVRLSNNRRQQGGLDPLFAWDFCCVRQRAHFPGDALWQVFATLSTTQHVAREIGHPESRNFYRSCGTSLYFPSLIIQT